MLTSILFIGCGRQGIGGTEVSSCLHILQLFLSLSTSFVNFELIRHVPGTQSCD